MEPTGNKCSHLRRQSLGQRLPNYVFLFMYFFTICFYGVYNLDSEIALISLLVPERGESLYIGLHKALFSTVCLLTRLLSLMTCLVF